MNIWWIAALAIAAYMLIRQNTAPAKAEGTAPVPLPNAIPKLAVPTASDAFEALQTIQTRLVGLGHFPSEVEAVVQPVSKLLLASPADPPSPKLP